VPCGEQLAMPACFNIFIAVWEVKKCQRTKIEVQLFI
jgi:hypothetical protein